jgi:hypothetical protein
MADKPFFWNSGTAKDPKRGYRWVLTTDNIPLYTLKKVSKPSFAVTETAHKYLNHTYYYPGRVEWNTVALTLADPVAPDAAKIVTQMIQNSGYNPATDETMTQTMSKAKSTAAIGNFQIEQIDAEGNAIETWTLINPWVKDVKYGELDYESDDLTNVELEIRYDYASLKTADGTDIWKAGQDG